MNDYMLLHMVWIMPSSLFCCLRSASWAPGWKKGQWGSSVDLDGHEKGQILCNLNRLAFMWWTILSYLILSQWHHIYNVRLFSGQLWKTETAAMQPVDWASVLCTGGINERVQTQVGLFSCSAGMWKEAAHPQPLLGTSIMTVCWQHHLPRILWNLWLESHGEVL